MEKRSTKPKKIKSSANLADRHSGTIKKINPFIPKEPPILLSNDSKKRDPTPLKSRQSGNKENQLKKDLTFNKSKAKKIDLTSLVKKKRKLKKSKKPGSRGNSLSEISKKLNGKKRNSFQAKPSLITQNSQKELKNVESSNKLTPRSIHPSPQYSHRTPDSVRLGQRANIPILTEKKKSKIPEIGYYCKRISLFENNKTLYEENNFSSIEKDGKANMTSDEYNTLPDKTVGLTEDSFFHNENYSTIAKTLKLDSFSESSEVEMNTSPVKKGLKTRNSEEIALVSLKFPIEEPIQKHQSLDIFASPTKTIQMYNSPEKKTVFTPESKRKSRTSQPKAPKKPILDYDSPGSFVFSLSSNSSEEFIFEQATKYQKIMKKDEEIQTDLLEMITDTKLLEGLKIIGKISECISLNH